MVITDYHPLVNSVGASPVELKRFSKTEEFTKWWQSVIALKVLRVFGDYQFTKK